MRVYPDDYWATGNLAGTYWQLKRFEERVPYVLRRAELRPNDFAGNVRAAQVLVQWGDDSPAQALPYVKRARAVDAQNDFHRSIAAWAICR